MIALAGDAGVACARRARTAPIARPIAAAARSYPQSRGHGDGDGVNTLPSQVIRKITLRLLPHRPFCVMGNFFYFWLVLA